MTQMLQISHIADIMSGDAGDDLGSSKLNRHAMRSLEYAITELFTTKIALVSSFGSASVVLLHMVSEIQPDLPVLFIDTGKLFPETLNYRDTLATRLGLSNIVSVAPDIAALNETDPDGSLWQSGPDLCCAMRKTAPLAAAIEPYSAWISGRKRYQNGQRQQLSVFEQDDDKVKINPLSFWTARDVQEYISAHGLPVHPLIAKGYPSIGCAPCTSPVKSGEDERAGRWRGQSKTECGIHFTVNKANEISSPNGSDDGQRRIKSWA